MSPRDLARVLFTLLGLVLLTYAAIYAVQVITTIPQAAWRTTLECLLPFFASSSIAGLALIVFRGPLSARLPDDRDGLPSQLDGHDLLRAALIAMGVLWTGAAVTAIVASTIAPPAAAGWWGQNRGQLLGLLLGMALILGSRPLARLLWRRPAHA